MNPLEALTFVGYTPSKNECVVVCVCNAKTLREAAARFFATQKGIDNPPCGIVAVFSGMPRCLSGEFGVDHVDNGLIYESDLEERP